VIRRRSMILCLLCVCIAEVGCDGDRRESSIVVRRRYKFHFSSAVIIASVMTFNSDAPGRKLVCYFMRKLHKRYFAASAQWSICDIVVLVPEYWCLSIEIKDAVYFTGL
jgi:hypothetical protein